MANVPACSDLYQRNEKLNGDAIQGILKHTSNEDETRDNNLQIALQHHLENDDKTMLIPTLTLHTRRSKEKYEHHRAKAIREKAELQKTIFSHKSKGAWSMGKKLNNKGAPPLIAVTRLEKRSSRSSSRHRSNSTAGGRCYYQEGIWQDLQGQLQRPAGYDGKILRGLRQVHFQDAGS